MLSRKKKIIDHKSVLLTDSEYNYYQEICRSLDSQHLKGEEHFKGLFEVDKEGYIIFLRVPPNKFVCVEAYMFLVTTMIHQHLSSAVHETYELKKEITELKNEMRQELNQIREEHKRLREMNSTVSTWLIPDGAE
jgi:uncharacterized coiled-coil DUF342 family protein